MGVRSVKLAVTDQDYAESILSVPTTGRLPEKAGEIALDEFTMDSLGVLHELGAPVSIQWTDSKGGQHNTDFTLCGWWASPTNFTEACAWVTAECAAGRSDRIPGYGIRHHGGRSPSAKGIGAAGAADHDRSGRKSGSLHDQSGI